MFDFLENTTAAELRHLPARFYPLFDVCHIVLCVLTVRKEAGRSFGFRHPLATWVACIVSSFAGSLLANPLLGKPMFAAFADEYLLGVATLSFALVFFSPGDLVYNLLKLQPIYLVMCFLKEIYRGKKVYAGLMDGAKAFPNSRFFVPIVTGVIKGNGSAFMAPFARYFRGDLRPDSSEILKPSVTTKECLLAAVLMLTVGADRDLVYLCLLGLFISVKLCSVLGQPIDPFLPFEKATFGFFKALARMEAIKDD